MKKQNKDKPEIQDIDCLEAFDHFYAYINKEIEDADTIAVVENHLSHCKSCFSREQMERKINEKMKQEKDDAPSEELQDRIKDLIKGF